MRVFEQKKRAELISSARILIPTNNITDYSLDIKGYNFYPFIDH